MLLPIPRRLGNGDKLRPEEVNSLLDGMQQQSFLSIGSSIGVSESGQPLDFRPQSFWVRINTDRKENRYGWSPVYLGGDKKLVTITDSYGGEVRQGKADEFPAIAIGGEANVVAGRVVRAWPSTEGDWLEFDSSSGSAAIAMTTRDFVTKVQCVGNKLVYTLAEAIVPATAYLSVTVRRQLTGGAVELLAGRTTTATCTNHEGPTIARTTGASGTVVFGLPEGDYSVTTQIMANEEAVPAYPATYTAPTSKADGSVAEASVTITLRGKGPTVTVTGPGPVFSVTASPPPGTTITNSTTTITAGG